MKYLLFKLIIRVPVFSKMIVIYQLLFEYLFPKDRSFKSTIRAGSFPYLQKYVRKNWRQNVNIEQIASHWLSLKIDYLSFTLIISVPVFWKINFKLWLILWIFFCKRSFFQIDRQGRIISLPPKIIAQELTSKCYYRVWCVPMSRCRIWFGQIFCMPKIYSKIRW